MVKRGWVLVLLCLVLIAAAPSNAPTHPTLYTNTIESEDSTNDVEVIHPLIARSSMSVLSWLTVNEGICVDGSGGACGAGSGNLNVAGTATVNDLTCSGCVGSTDVGFNYAGAGSKGGKATDADKLDNLDSTAFQRNIGGDCGANNYAYGVEDNGNLKCRADRDTDTNTDTWITTQTCPSGEVLSSVGKNSKVCVAVGGGGSTFTGLSDTPSNYGTNGQCVKTDGGTLIYGDCGTGGGGTSYWTTRNGVLRPSTYTQHLSLGEELLSASGPMFSVTHDAGNAATTGRHTVMEISAKGGDTQDGFGSQIEFHNKQHISVNDWTTGKIGVEWADSTTVSRMFIQLRRDADSSPQMRDRLYIDPNHMWAPKKGPTHNPHFNLGEAANPFNRLYVESIQFGDGSVQSSASTGGGTPVVRHSLDAADGSPVDVVYVNNDGSVDVSGVLEVNQNGNKATIGAFLGDGSVRAGLAVKDDSLFGNVGEYSVYGVGNARIEGNLRADGGLLVGDDEGIYRSSEDVIMTDDKFVVNDDMEVGNNLEVKGDALFSRESYSKVGIGKNPSVKLDVSGDIHADGNICDGNDNCLAPQYTYKKIETFAVASRGVKCPCDTNNNYIECGSEFKTLIDKGEYCYDVEYGDSDGSRYDNYQKQGFEFKVNADIKATGTICDSNGCIGQSTQSLEPVEIRAKKDINCNNVETCYLGLKDTITIDYRDTYTFIYKAAIAGGGQDVRVFTCHWIRLAGDTGIGGILETWATYTEGGLECSHPVFRDDFGRIDYLIYDYASDSVKYRVDYDGGNYQKPNVYGTITMINQHVK